MSSKSVDSLSVLSESEGLEVTGSADSSKSSVVGFHALLMGTST